MSVSSDWCGLANDDNLSSTFSCPEGTHRCHPFSLAGLFPTSEPSASWLRMIQGLLGSLTLAGSTGAATIPMK